mgnify:CR=1 FL=1
MPRCLAGLGCHRCTVDLHAVDEGWEVLPLHAAEESPNRLFLGAGAGAGAGAAALAFVTMHTKKLAAVTPFSSRVVSSLSTLPE